jgi:hypothetical protein
MSGSAIVENSDLFRQRMPEFLTTRQVAKLLGFRDDTLKCWRREHRGPPFVHIERRVRYPVRLLVYYLAHRVQGREAICG